MSSNLPIEGYGAGCLFPRPLHPCGIVCPHGEQGGVRSYTGPSPSTQTYRDPPSPLLVPHQCGVAPSLQHVPPLHRTKSSPSPNPVCVQGWGDAEGSDPLPAPPCPCPHRGGAAVGRWGCGRRRLGQAFLPGQRTVLLLHQLWYFQSLRGEGRSAGGSKEKQRSIGGCRELGGPPGGGNQSLF